MQETTSYRSGCGCEFDGETIVKCERHRSNYSDTGTYRVIRTGSPEHLATFTDDQLCTLAASTDPAHIVYGFAAECELSIREARRQTAASR
jgi:hypothetical protein